MDQANTLQIPRIVVDDNDVRPGEQATVVVPRPQENVPAIAQEAPTGVVSSPPNVRTRQRRLEGARARGGARKQAADANTEGQTPPKGIQRPVASEVDLFTPATPDPPVTGSLSQRLDG